MLGRFLCLVGRHRWARVRTDDGQPYRACRRCGKDKGTEAINVPDQTGGTGMIGGPV